MPRVVTSKMGRHMSGYGGAISQVWRCMPKELTSQVLHQMSDEVTLPVRHHVCAMSHSRLADIANVKSYVWSGDDHITIIMSYPWWSDVIIRPSQVWCPMPDAISQEWCPMPGEVMPYHKWDVICLVRWCRSRNASPQILHRNLSSRLFLLTSKSRLWWDRLMKRSGIFRFADITR